MKGQDNLFEKAAEYPIKEVAERYLQLKHIGGGTYVALCPFHNDRHLGSFKIYTRRNKFNCYSCGERGGVIDFVAKIEGISLLDAARKILGEADPNAAPVKREVKRTKHIKKRDAEHLAKVYDAFVKACPPLTEEHQKTISSWGLDSFSEDKKYFFEFPKCNKAFRKAFKEELEKAGIKDKKTSMTSILTGVPGFYFDRAKNKFLFSEYKGIGIIQQGLDGKTSALQVRCDEKQGSRYKLFSSGFADTDSLDEQYALGASIEQVCDAIMIDNPKRFVITEGKKKALMISERFSCSVLSLNGVTTIKPADDFLKLAKEQERKVVTVAFDMDSKSKKSVKKALKVLSDKIEEAGFTVKFLVWDEALGKGIDDFLLNPDPNKGKLMEVTKKTFKEMMEKQT